MREQANTANRFVDDFAKKAGVNREQAIDVIQKYQAVHACKCGIATCSGHDLCHG